ncbi:restriction endonuclease subunit S [Luteimonas sp. TWI662]|uniref:restriction endonuclease subunit S n=1 Tax=Luteimonas sp. TWI662 TaxID=3136789 RepID=UPI003209A6A4
MSLPRYPEYKDSGVEWLGEVPAHWTVDALRRRASLNPSKSEIGELPDDALVSFLPMEAVGERGELDLSRTRQISDVLSGYTYFREGDVTFAKITPCFENGKGARMVGLHGGCGFGTTELTVARPNSDLLDSHYLDWVFRSMPFRNRGEAAMYGAGGQKRVPDEFVREFVCGWPDVDEQISIARFLDRETARIDALIAEQETLLALLAEKRQATISHAVTRGLDPNAPMKDSCIAWLGEVPAHWSILPIKWAIRSIEQGWSPQCEGHPAETPDEWGVMKVGCVNGGIFDPGENKKLPSELQPMSVYALRSGDLLVSRANTRDLVGSAAVVPQDHPNLLLCDKLYRLRTDPNSCDPAFAAAFLGTPHARAQIELQATGASSSMLNIAQSTLLEMPLPLPSVSEQVEIISWLEGQVRKLDQARDSVERAVDLLKERRRALISAAVTGQIDVRGLVSEEAS